MSSNKVIVSAVAVGSSVPDVSAIRVAHQRREEAALLQVSSQMKKLQKVKTGGGLMDLSQDTDSPTKSPINHTDEEDKKTAELRAKHNGLTEAQAALLIKTHGRVVNASEAYEKIQEINKKVTPEQQKDYLAKQKKTKKLQLDMIQLNELLDQPIVSQLEEKDLKNAEERKEARDLVGMLHSCKFKSAWSDKILPHEKEEVMKENEEVMKEKEEVLKTLRKRHEEFLKTIAECKTQKELERVWLEIRITRVGENGAIDKNNTKMKDFVEYLFQYYHDKDSALKAYEDAKAFVQKVKKNIGTVHTVTFDVVRAARLIKKRGEEGAMEAVQTQVDVMEGAMDALIRLKML